MKLSTFRYQGKTRIGVVQDGEGASGSIVDLSNVPSTLPDNMTAFLALGEEAVMLAGDIVDNQQAKRYALEDVELLAPVPRPGKILAIGLNYADHIAETGREAPQFPMWFNKQPSCVIGTGQPIVIPSVSDKVDYEGELVVVIGTYGRHVPRDRAHEIVAGYMCGNDVSVRDLQRRTTQFTLGKGCDTHGPTGPWITLKDEVGDPHNLDLKCYVNGVCRQQSNTKHLIFDIWHMISELTSVFPLEPGDLIFTGTPGGVGGAMSPPQFLRAGDIVRVEIDSLGVLENPVVDEVVETRIGIL